MHKFLVDTNILFYMVDTTEAEKHETAKKWFHSILDKKGYFVSAQNLREFASVALQKTALTAKEIKSHIEVFAESFPVLNDTLPDYLAATEIARAAGIKYWDSLLIATMKRNRISRIIT